MVDVKTRLELLNKIDVVLGKAPIFLGMNKDRVFDALRCRFEGASLSTLPELSHVVDCPSAAHFLLCLPSNLLKGNYNDDEVESLIEGMKALLDKRLRTNDNHRETRVNGFLTYMAELAWFYDTSEKSQLLLELSDCMEESKKARITTMHSLLVFLEKRNASEIEMLFAFQNIGSSK